jgi:hypothetical protein
LYSKMRKHKIRDEGRGRRMPARVVTPRSGNRGPRAVTGGEHA